MRGALSPAGKPRGGQNVPLDGKQKPRSQVSRASADSLVDKTRRLTNQGERLELYRKAERILADEAVIVPLLYWRSHLLVKAWVRRYPTAAMGGWFWKDVIIDPH
jgi:ABC-type transport system substrate-binding protein